MGPRTRETLESLRVTLQKLEQSADPSSDGQDVTELKQILLTRIAELETLQALQPVEEISPPPALSELPPIAAISEEEPAQEAGEASNLQKLN